MIKKIFIIFTFALIIFFNVSKVQAKEANNLDTTQIIEYIEEYDCKIKVIPITKFQEDEVYGDYYSITYQIITENCNLTECFIPLTVRLPDETIITDTKTIEDKRYFKDKFKIMVPKEYSDEEFAAMVQVIVSFKLDNEEQIHEIDRFISMDSRKSSLEINIVDSENSKPINKVNIDIENCDFHTNEKYMSDKNGKVFVDRIGKGDTIIKILNVPEGYNTLEKQKIDIQYDKDEKYTIKLEHKKGNLIINNIPEASFAIYDEQGNLIGEYVTDKEGIMEIQDLNTGKYILKQNKVPDGYKKIEDISLEIKENETFKIEVLNTKLPEEQNPSDKPELDEDNKLEESKDKLPNDNVDNKNEEEPKVPEKEEDETNEVEENIPEEKIEEDKKAGNEEEIEDNTTTGKIIKDRASITNPKQNQSNKNMKKLPRTGNDYFEIKLIIFELIVFILYILIINLKNKRQTLKKVCQIDKIIR